MNGGVAENGREDLRVRRPEQLRGVLQEIAHADGSDEHGQRRRGAQGLIGESLDENAERCADQHGQQDADERGQTEAGDGEEADIRADHDDIAVGKVQHLGNAVNHGIAQGNDRVNAAETHAVDEMVQKTHGALNSLSFLGTSESISADRPCKFIRGSLVFMPERAACWGQPFPGNPQ